MPDTSNRKIVSIILLLKTGTFNTALGNGYKCIGVLQLRKRGERGQPEVRK